MKSDLTPQEISLLRGALGTLAWKASQTGPRHQAEVSFLLSEIPMAKISTLLSVNKITRQIRRESGQPTGFPQCGLPWNQIAAMVWVRATGQTSRVRFAPRSILDGNQEHVALVSWRSTKTRGESLGSNRSEVQAIPVGEDVVFLLRAMWFEVHGGSVVREQGLGQGNSWRPSDGFSRSL